MHLHQIAIQIGSQRETLNAREVTPARLHGVFYDVVKRVDEDAATWLHEHRAPKPYTLAPAHFDKQRRELAGILVSTLSDESAELITTAFHHAYQYQRPTLPQRPHQKSQPRILDSDQF